MKETKIEQLIIGSHAMRHWFPDFKREPNDLDIMSPIPKESTREVEYHWIPEFENILKNNKDDTYVDADNLLTMKLAHAGWDIHWNKTMFDILFLKSKGCKPDRKLYKKLVKGWIKVHGKKWAQLKGKDSETFFVDAIKRKYIHDDIHEAVAVYDKPLYEQLIVEGVTCGEEAFNKLSLEDQVLLAKEEIWVTALERYLIPLDFKTSPYAAYMKSLKKLATTMSSGYFKYFILTNFDKFVGDRSTQYIEKFKQAEQEGKLRLYGT